MSVVFVANVGNHDIQMHQTDLLPEELHGKYTPARLLGAELAANFERYQDAIEAPLVGVSIRWLLEHEGVNPDELYIHLFASDQPAPPVTPEGEWLKDTWAFGDVIRHYLNSGRLEWVSEEDGRNALRFPRKRFHMHRISGNPADYKNMYDYFGEQLAQLAWRLDPADRVYLEITGGTPAMTSMLLLAGVDVFGARAETLYVERGADRPQCVGVGRRLLARQVRDTLREQIGLHAYAAARETVAQDGELVLRDAERRTLVTCVLQYAQSRLAFDFKRARAALSGAAQFASGEVQSEVRRRDRELKSPEMPALLAELIHSSRIKFNLGEYADFTQRVFRFQEAAFRHIAEKMGMRCDATKNNKDEFVDKDWVASVPGLDEFLADYTAPDGRRYRPLDLNRGLNRVSLGALVGFFMRSDAAWAGYRDTNEKLHGFSQLAGLRNSGLAGHGFEGIGREDLDNAYGGDASRVTRHMEYVYQDLFDRELEESPYESVNDLLLGLLA